MFHFREEWKKEVARDTRALGSEVFFLLVFARALIEPYYVFLWQLVVAWIALRALSFFLDADLYVARGFILAVLVSAFYTSLLFSVFAALVATALLFSAHYIGIGYGKISKGVVLSLMCVAAGYLGSSYIMGL